jgi:hypothetical protein
MNDNEVITAVTEQRDKVRSHTSVDQIISRGNMIRARRRIPAAVSGLAVVAAAAAVVVGAGLSGAFGSAPSTGTIRTMAFTLTTNANGTATLTINPHVLLEPSTLQSDLQQDGIAAHVTTGSFCSSDPSPAGFPQVVSQASSPTSVTVTINPAAMRAGTELSFGNFQYSASSSDTEIELIDTNSYTCSSALPTPPPSGDGVLIVGRGNGIGEPAGS